MQPNLASTILFQFVSQNISLLFRNKDVLWFTYPIMKHPISYLRKFAKSSHHVPNVNLVLKVHRRGDFEKGKYYNL